MIRCVLLTYCCVQVTILTEQRERRSLVQLGVTQIANNLKSYPNYKDVLPEELTKRITCYPMGC